MVVQTEEVDLESLLYELRGELSPSVIKSEMFRNSLNWYGESISRRRTVLHRHGPNKVREKVLEKARQLAQDFLTYRREKRENGAVRVPPSLDVNHLRIHENWRVRINDETRKKALGRLKTRVVDLLDSAPLQEMIHLNTANFGNLRYELKNNGLTWFTGLVFMYGEDPFERGESQLKIDQYGGAPISSYMFENHKGVWDYPPNRILATRVLVDELSKLKDIHDIDVVDFVSKSNPINRSLKEMLVVIRRIYGLQSHYIAMIEACVITPSNYHEFKERTPKFRFTENQIKEISAKAREILNGSSEKAQIMREFQRAGYSEREIARVFGVSPSTIRNHLYDQEHRARNRRDWSQRILKRLGIGGQDELTEETISHIRSRSWSSRKKIAYELYLRGFSFQETGRIIGTEADPYKPAYKQHIEFFIYPSEYDKRLHKKRRRERKLNKKLTQLCEGLGIDRQKFEEAVNHDYKVMDARRIAEKYGFPVRLVSQYLVLTGKHALTTRQVDLSELKTWWENGFNISPSNMQRYNPYTRNLYMRVSNGGRNYKISLLEIGVDPQDVYKQSHLLRHQLNFSIT